jgi:hypothetical protein
LEKCGRKMLWPDISYYAGILLQGKKKAEAVPVLN